MLRRFFVISAFLSLAVAAFSKAQDAAHVHHVHPIRPHIASLHLPSGYPYQLYTFAIPLDRAHFRIRDTGMARTLAPMFGKERESLIFNGGFFDPDMNPEGYTVSEGRELSRFKRELGGGVLTITRGVARLYDTQTYTPGLAADLDFAMQCRPRLVVDAAVNIRSDNGQRADRTALCIRHHGLRVDVVIARAREEHGTGGPTLFQFAELLAREGCEQALNLDGGPSTAVAWHDESGPHVLEPRSSIRHVVSVQLH